MKNVPVLSQAATQLNLAWNEGDAIDMSAIVLARDWSGTYTAEVRAEQEQDATLAIALSVTATLGVWDAINGAFTPGAGSDTLIRFTGSAIDSSAVADGDYWWDMKRSAGPLRRLRGRVTVVPSVTA